MPTISCSTPRSDLAGKERPSDIFLATYPKCGTTLIQQIVHGLRTVGDMDFRDISGVVPWLGV
ncbi:MAG: sulfotransferase domain-containing protein [Myxococcales bacterium]